MHVDAVEEQIFTLGQCTRSQEDLLGNKAVLRMGLIQELTGARDQAIQHQAGQHNK